MGEEERDCGRCGMIELVVRKITVEMRYVPESWADKIFFYEVERTVARATLDGKVEVGIKSFDSSLTRWFVLRDVPLDIPFEKHKAYLSV